MRMSMYCYVNVLLCECIVMCSMYCYVNVLLCECIVMCSMYCYVRDVFCATSFVFAAHFDTMESLGLI